MQTHFKYAFIMAGMLSVSACGASDTDEGEKHKGGSADILISGSAHHFSDVNVLRALMMI